MVVFWAPIAIGAMIGKLLGGRLANVVSIRLSHLWLVLVVAAVQMHLVFAPPRLLEEGIDPLRVLLPLSTWAIVIFAALNVRVPSMWLVLAGALANALVITANGGLMPVSAEVLRRAGMHDALAFGDAHPGVRLPRTKDVLLAPAVTQLEGLSDVLVMPPLPRSRFISPGDLALALGLGGIVVSAMRSARTHSQLQQQEAPRGAADTIPPWARASALRANRADWLLRIDAAVA